MGFDPALRPSGRRLIVNSDDFGRSVAINKAVISAHREGILTTASLMVNEPACAEAVILAKQNPGLGVGLHLSLLCGRSALPPARIPGLVNAAGQFTDSPLAAGLKYFFTKSIRSQLREEIHEQFTRFRSTGLVLDHVNGHLHLHLHPVIFDILKRDARQLGITHLRLTRDPLLLNLKLAKGKLLYRTTHAFIFGALSARTRPSLEKLGLKHTRHVFGLLQDARVDSAYILKLLPRLPAGDSELYSHPSLDEFKHEFEALTDPRVVRQVKELGISLIRYQDL